MQITPRRSDYLLLARDTPQRPQTRRYRRRWRIVFYIATTLLLVPLLLLVHGIPPPYDDVRAFERRLPQHSFTHHPDGRPQRYLRFPGHLWGHGLNNVLQEALLMSYLAYVSNVSFVFEDYTWSHAPLPWTLYGFALRPTRLPINAIISGPTAGGPMQDAPLAVSAEFYESVCSGPDVIPYVITPANAPKDADGTVLIDWWRSQIAPLDNQCIEVDAAPQDLFDLHFFGGPRFLSLFEPLAASPILRDFTWSPLVQSALARNFALLQPRFAKDVLAPSDTAQSTLDGLVALHLRRGDYIRHCPHLATWGANYMGMNQHPSLLDRFDPTHDDNADPNGNEKLAYYLSHCYPSTSELVARLRAVRDEHPGLSRVYVLSNGGGWSLQELANALEEDGWADVASTRELVLDGEQYHVSMAVDMAIAERAEVFVGNGFSSLTSNVVMLRLAKGMDPSSIRFL